MTMPTWDILQGDYQTGQTDAISIPGMSGGAVFNKYGDLIGIVLSHGTDPHLSQTQFVIVEEIHEVLEDLRAGKKS